MNNIKIMRKNKTGNAQQKRRVVSLAEARRMDRYVRRQLRKNDLTPEELDIVAWWLMNGDDISTKLMIRETNRELRAMGYVF